MGVMFAGLLFLTIDIKLGPLCLTPNLIGYMLLNYGMSRADGRDARLRSRRDMVLYLVPVGAVEFVLTVLRLAGSVPSVLFLAARMAALWAAASWAAMLEEDSEYDLEAGKIGGAWKIVCALHGVLAVIYLFPLVVRDEDMLSLLALFAMIFTIAGLIAMVVYLVRFLKFKKNWEEDIRERNEEKQ